MGYLASVISGIWEALLSASGAHLTVSMGGIFFLGFPAAFWFGAYAYSISAVAGVPLWLSLGIGIIFALLAGLLFAFFYARMSNDSFTVVTLASVLAVDALLRSWDSLTGGVLGIPGVPRPDIAGTLLQLAVIQGVLALAGLAAESLLVNTSFGRSLRALKENKSVLLSLGTSPDLVGRTAIIFASLFAGLGGILAVWRIQFLDPSLGGFALLLQGLTIAIVSNVPRASRVFLATVFLVLVPELLRFFALPDIILGYARSFIYGLVLIFLIHYITTRTAIKRNV